LKPVARLSPEARPETSKDPSQACSEIEVIIRDFESGPGVFADDRDGAFAFGSRRDIELLVGAQARILYDHCRGVRWGMMPHTAASG
jgi:hypothetical protein